MPVLIFRRYMLFGLVPAEMDVGVTFLEILQAEFKPVYKYSWTRLSVYSVGMPSRSNNNICAVLEFENSMVRM